MIRGRRVGVVRDDLPDDLLIELALSVIRTLDRWAVRQKVHAPGSHGTPDLFIGLIRDLIERR